VLVESVAVLEVLVESITVVEVLVEPVTVLEVLVELVTVLEVLSLASRTSTTKVNVYSTYIITQKADIHCTGCTL